MQRIVIAGGTGFVGKALRESVLARGDECIILTRNASQSHHIE